MKQSRLKRIVSKKLARRLASADGAERAELERQAEEEATEVVERMRAKGYRLVTRLEDGEGVFVREDGLVGLHVQLPGSLYKRLEAACRREGLTKRAVITLALERYLEGPA